MSITIPLPDGARFKDENKDVVGDAVKRTDQERSYDPYQWQDAANGKAKNRVFYGAGQVELVEAQPDVPRMIELPDALPARAAAIGKFRRENPDLEPHYDEGCSEITRLLKENPNASATDVFNLAVYRVCKNHGLPLMRPATIEAKAGPTREEIERDEMKMLDANFKKVRTRVGQNYEDVGRAIRETTPAAKPRGRR